MQTAGCLRIRQVVKIEVYAGYPLVTVILVATTPGSRPPCSGTAGDVDLDQRLEELIVANVRRRAGRSEFRQ